MKRMFWLGVGLAAGAYVARRAQSAAESLTPAGIGAFGAEVRAGMAEREHELAVMVERRTGDRLPTLGEALADPPAHAVSSSARARRAGA